MTRWLVRGAARSFRLMSVRVWSTCPGLRLFLSTIVVERSAVIINPLEIAGELQSSFTEEKYGCNISLNCQGGGEGLVAQFRLNLSTNTDTVILGIRLSNLLIF